MSENRLNIWVFNPTATPPTMGGLVRFHYFYKYLSQYGHTMKLYTSSVIHNTKINKMEKGKKILTEIIDDVEYNFIKTTSYYGNGIRRILNMLQFPVKTYFYFRKAKEKPDIIIGSSPPLFGALGALLLAKKIGVPCLLDIRDLWPESFIDYDGINEKSIIMKILYELEHWMYKKADGINFTTEGAYQYICDKGWKEDIPKNKIYYVNNGVDIEEFYRNAQEITLKDADIESDYFKVIYVGALRKANDIENLVLAIDTIQKKHPEERIKCIIYGEGSEMENLTCLCKERGIENRVIFKGYVEKKYIPYIVTKADVNILNYKQSRTLKYGGSQNKLFEYLASGKPVISSVHMNYNLIEQFGSGIIVEDNSLEKYAEAILKIKRMTPKRREEMGKSGQRCAKEFDYKVLSIKMKEAICETRTNAQRISDKK